MGRSTACQRVRWEVLVHNAQGMMTCWAIAHGRRGWAGQMRVGNVIDRACTNERLSWAVLIHC